MKKHFYTLEFSNINSLNFSKVGGKCASLGEMIQAGIDVPNGFAVTTDAFLNTIVRSNLNDFIEKEFKKIKKENLKELEIISEKIKSKFAKIKIPKEIEFEVLKAYEKLGNNVPVAVRSSATAEDLPNASFAGQQDTFLWVCGKKNLLKSIYNCWASLYTVRAISYRIKNNINQTDVLMGVGVQKMVNSKVSGVAITLNPLNGDKTKIFIESSWGLGETIVSGNVNPDNFVVEKVLHEILERKISKKTIELIADVNSQKTIQREIKGELQTKPSLTDNQILEVALLSKKLEKHFKCAQDVEWTFDFDLPTGKNLFALQSRPETIWSQKKKKPFKVKKSNNLESIVYNLNNPYQKENKN